MLLISELEKYMLPCLNKKFLGVECMGCGLQRSFSLLIQGEFIAAFKMYPAIYTLVLLFVVVGINAVKPFKSSNRIIIVLAILNVAIIVGSYAFKILI
ncbi:DUF2752 domain-containing protein [Hyunsoonleella flava]|uniref:DUF2752 domain-containing protein n=1 Tax=Hyunsoonleella flava TaxID=2527939 RepID=A0A4Q9FJH2_9FLAO|nr:DUF2752 domain-containing protein [Hyunsoonleella flava]TBN06805.1 DUF2752 domain-containing protein [Hyunsoonleella flava]